MDSSECKEFCRPSRGRFSLKKEEKRLYRILDRGAGSVYAIPLVFEGPPRNEESRRGRADAIAMSLSPIQQAQEIIARATRILVITREHPTVDTIASAAACSMYLKKQGKPADIVIPGFDMKRSPSFISGLENIRPSTGAMRSFHIALDVSEVALDELMYDVKDGKLDITVVPKEKEWSPKDVSFDHGKDRYDLVIALDAPDRKSLGSIAREQADFLYRTPVINIDHSSGNEHWGQLNLVSMNAVSTTEVLYELMNAWNGRLIDEPIATALLAGMIAKTRSFRTPNVTPKTLATSSQLIAMGAKREDIVNGLWRTRSIGTLKLWGRALTRLQEDRNLGLVWTALSHKDFLEAGTSADTLEDVIDELLAYAPQAQIIVLLYETPEQKDGICLTIATKAPYNANDLGRPLGASGTPNRSTACLVRQTLLEAMNHVIETLKKDLTALKR